LMVQAALSYYMMDPCLIMPVTIFLGSHTGGALEIAVEGCEFGEPQHIGRFLERQCGPGLDEPLGLCHHVFLNPFVG